MGMDSVAIRPKRFSRHSTSKSFEIHGNAKFLIGNGLRRKRFSRHSTSKSIEILRNQVSWIVSVITLQVFKPFGLSIDRFWSVPASRITQRSIWSFQALWRNPLLIFRLVKPRESSHLLYPPGPALNTPTAALKPPNLAYKSIMPREYLTHKSSMRVLSYFAGRFPPVLIVNEVSKPYF